MRKIVLRLVCVLLTAYLAAVFAQGQQAKKKAKAPAKTANVAAPIEPTGNDEAAALADLDKEIEGSDGVQSAQTQMTQQGQQIVTVDRSSMPNILAAVDMVADKDLKAPPAGDQTTNSMYVRSVEFGFFGAIDWFANGMVLFAMHREAGNYVFALHEASFEFPSLPWNFHLKIGRMFPDAGRLNTIHQHDRVFTGIPRVHGQLFDTVIGRDFWIPAVSCHGLLRCRFTASLRQAYLTVARSAIRTTTALQRLHRCF